VRSRRLVTLALAGGVCIVIGLIAAATLRGGGGNDDAPSPNVAVVWGNPIPRSLFSKGMSVKVQSIRAATGAAPKPGSVEYRRLQDDAMRQLVTDVTVVAEARKLGLVTIESPVAAFIVRDPARVPLVWRRVYRFAARGVPDPDDPKIVHATRFDDHELPEILTPHQLKIYNDWQARRDRVASAWFGRLFERYRAHTSYAPAFRPSAE
jgi:hypothetical protein